MRVKDKYEKSGRNLTKFVFLGQKIYFGKTTYTGIKLGIQSNFVSHTYDESWTTSLKIIKKINPQVVIIYRPEVYDIEFLTILRQEFITVAYFTEPLPFFGFEAEFDLIRRYAPFENYDMSNCDFNVTYNPVTCKILNEKSKIILTHPIPVSDDIFVRKSDLSDSIGGIFLGRVTKERNEYLMPLKHRFNLTVLDHGELNESFFNKHIFAVNLHSDSYPNFENRIFYHMAQSLLVLTEPVIPDYGLEDGKHYLGFDSPESLKELVIDISKNNYKYYEVANSGFTFAQEFSTSKFLKKLIQAIKIELD